MLPWETVATTRTPEGAELVLARRGTEWVVRAQGRTLMSSAAHHSEEALARLAFEKHPGAKCVLLGGLGLGFTLRAVLDGLPPDGRVVVAELSPALLDWNRSHVAQLAGRPLEDPRVEVQQRDVLGLLLEARGRYDAVLLDVDNGPSALTQRSNEQLYDDAGIYGCLSALKGNGVLTVWSAGPDVKYLDRLQRAGFHAKALTVTARPEGGPRHVVFIATRQPMPRFERKRVSR